jgi:hypothetical protein
MLTTQEIKTLLADWSVELSDCRGRLFGLEETLVDGKLNSYCNEIADVAQQQAKTMTQALLLTIDFINQLDLLEENNLDFKLDFIKIFQGE